MASIIESVDRLGGLAEDKPYVPFLPALERGILKDPESLARSPENPLGVDVGNSIIPNSKRAGVVILGPELAGVDHVGIERSGKQIIISPASKEGVDSKGHINQEGAVVIGTQEGRVRIAGFAIDTIRNPWRFDRVRRSRAKWQTGRLAMVLTGWELPYDYEVKDILETDQQILVPRQRLL